METADRGHRLGPMPEVLSERRSRNLPNTHCEPGSDLPRPPWLPFTADGPSPARHVGSKMGLFCDTHDDALQPGWLRVHHFREPGSEPALRDFAGE